MALTSSQREKSECSQVGGFPAALFEKLNARGLVQSTRVSVSVAGLTAVIGIYRLLSPPCILDFPHPRGWRGDLPGGVT